ncbi:MAG: GAF domain-containing protein, partial [Acidobacteriota bacterium]
MTSGMSTPLHALIVEDRPADAELMLHELRRADFNPDWVRVETEQDYLARLDPTLDIILADYHQPQFDALRALNLLQERGLDIPFIVITGILGDELAVELIKRGAADFLLKDRLGRLGQAVAKALEGKKLRGERKRVEEERARLLAETEHNLQRIRTLYEIGLATTSTLDLQAVLDVLLEKIDLLVPHSAATTVRLFDKETGELEPVACRHLDEEDWKAAMRENRGGMVRTVFKNKAPLIIDNVQRDSRTPDPEFFRQHGLVSYLGVPLIAKGEVLGVLSFFTKEKHEFSDEEVKFLSMLAGQLAMSIYNSRLYEQTKKQAVELDKSNKVKTEFLTIMSHELRTPLGVIMQYTGMLEDRMLGEI